MKYVIIGSGQIGTALARIFARKNVEVGIANSRGPETLESLAKEAGSSCARFRLKRLIGLRLFSSQYHSLRTRRSRRSLSSGTARFSLMSRMRSVLRHKLWEVASLPRSSVRLSLARASSKPSTTCLQHSSGQIRTRRGNDRPYLYRAMIPKQVK